MKTRSEINFAIGIIVFCLFNHFYLIPSQVVAEGSSPVYPMMVNGMLLFFGIALLVEGVFQLRKEKTDPAAEKQTLKIFWERYWRPLTLLAAMTIWILSLDLTGFLPSTIIFLFCSSLIFGGKNLKRISLLSLSLPTIVFSLFHWVNAPLPAGPLEHLILLIIR
jgi:Tripartite tricarboxylate transporter TctB family